jgi:hypothetical protein
MGARGTRADKERLKHRQRKQAQIRWGARGTRAQRQGTQRAPLTHLNGEHFVRLGWGYLTGTVLFMCYIKGCRRCAPDLNKMHCTIMYACSQYHSTMLLLRHMKGRRRCVSLLDLNNLHSITMNACSNQYHSYQPPPVYLHNQQHPRIWRRH